MALSDDDLTQRWFRTANKGRILTDERDNMGGVPDLDQRRLVLWTDESYLLPFQILIDDVRREVPLYLNTIWVIPVQTR